MLLKGSVDLVLTGNGAGADGEVGPHEPVEAIAVLLAKTRFHREPVFVVDLLLQPMREPHQYEVANKVGLGQIETGGVHTLKDELGVVPPKFERDIDQLQSLDTFEGLCRVGPPRFEGGKEEAVVRLDTVVIVLAKGMIEAQLLVCLLVRTR